MSAGKFVVVIVVMSLCASGGNANAADATLATEWNRVVLEVAEAEDGFLTLMDRRKDMIISGGFNIYPSDLEAVVIEHPEVEEVAVIGMHSDDWGETPIGVVVGPSDAEAIKEYGMY